MPVARARAFRSPTVVVKVMERSCHRFGDARVERLAGISGSHLYNLRGGTPYQRTRRRC
jgi:hypothetical protein